MSALSGSVTGESRADLINKATATATKYMGVKCVRVFLSGESFDDSGAFSANFEAQEHHPLELRSYGPNVCRDCGKKDWPHERLPQWRANR